MPVVSVVLELRLAGYETARRKATEAEAILGKLRKHFNISVADLGRDEPGDRTALGLAAVARTRKEARERLDRAADALAAHPRVEILKAAFDQ